MEEGIVADGQFYFFPYGGIYFPGAPFYPEKD